MIPQVSLGVRFTTLPDATLQVSSRGAVQPPTTITGLFNPMMGHLSAAYAARVSQDLSLCSRFDFNVYSYDSEWTMGAEWWMRRSSPEFVAQKVEVGPSSVHPKKWDGLLSPSVSDPTGVVKARISTNNVSAHALQGLITNCWTERFTVVGRSTKEDVSQSRRHFGSVQSFQTD